MPAVRQVVNGEWGRLKQEYSLPFRFNTGGLNHSTSQHLNLFTFTDVAAVGQRSTQKGKSFAVSIFPSSKYTWSSGALSTVSAPPAGSTFQAFTSVYQRPLYSRLSTSKEIVSIVPAFKRDSLILSPQMDTQTFFGYWSPVSTIISCFFHWPFLPFPVCNGSTWMSLAVNCIVADFSDEDKGSHYKNQGLIRVTGYFLKKPGIRV